MRLTRRHLRARFQPSVAPILLALLLAAGQSAAAAAPASTVAVEIRGADSRPAVSLHLQGERVRITLADGNRVLDGVPKESGKRKYAFGGSGPFAEVKPGDSGFKLRGPDGKLRWKVKLDANSVKVSDNEEGKRPIVLKLRSGGALDVRREGAALGSVDFKAGRDGVQVRDNTGRLLYKSEGAPSALYGLLLVAEIPEPERAILMAELLVRQR